MMASRISFLTLPTEVRLMIYNHYLENEEEGYVFNSQEGKLTAANSQPIDVRLMFTCKLIARELKAFALRTRTLNFSTSHSTSLSKRARAFIHLLNVLHAREKAMFASICPHLTSEIRDEVTAKYPSFTPFLDPSSVMAEDSRESYTFYEQDEDEERVDHIPSAYRQAITYGLRTALDYLGTSYIRLIFGDYGSSCSHDLSSILQLSHQPWIIPSWRELNQMAETLLSKYEMNEWRAFQRNVCRYYRFSAAAVAINFLRYLPTSTRLAIRNIRLHEDRPSLAMSACHCVGFIPFCQENPSLRIERRLNIWQTALFSDTPFWDLEIYPNLDLPTGRIRHCLASWIMETEALVAAGMPAKSFSVVLDGHPAREQCSVLFSESIQRACAWQAAMVGCWRRGSLPPPSLFDRAEIPFYTFERFPEVLKQVVSGSGMIRCNFQVKERWDVKELIRERTTWSIHDWSIAWKQIEPCGSVVDLFEPSEELQNWKPVPEWAFEVRRHFHSKFGG